MVGTADFLRALLARRRPVARPPSIVRKAVVHLGMPKAASTSIQMALHAAEDATLVPNGIWFSPLDDAFNDCVLYDHLVDGDEAAIGAYAKAKMEAAAAAAADTVIFSAERLFMIDEVGEQTKKLGEIIGQWADEVSFVVVLRELGPFLRSYVVQMMYNGAVTLENYRLAEWIIDQARSIAECGFPVDFLSMERKDESRNIAEALVGVGAGREIRLELDRANVTPGRPLIYALAEGFAARIHAIDCRMDVNSQPLDEFRTDFARRYDRTMKATTDAAEVYRVVQELNGAVEEQVSFFIDRCFEQCDPEKRAYYDALLTGQAPSEIEIGDSPAQAESSANIPGPHAGDLCFER
jgi:hypothetical protein